MREKHNSLGKLPRLAAANATPLPEPTQAGR